MPELPSGILTFVFTDVEGSTRLLRQLGDGYGSLMAEHRHLLREAFSKRGGHEVDAQGDSFFVAFTRPRDAVLAAVAAQRSLLVHPWPLGVVLRVRIGVHTGPAELSGERYIGLSVHRAARICAAGHGGQILVSQATVALIEDAAEGLPEVDFRDLGEQRLKDFERPVRVHQAVAPGLPQEYPPLSTLARAVPPTLRASDADRDRSVSALSEHAAAGRLTLEEFAERKGRALAAATLAELEELTLDLPGTAPERPARRPKRVTVVIFSDTEQTGRWRLPRFSLAWVLFGNADLDLRQAELTGTVASITALVLLGNIDLYVPEGLEVDLGGLAVLGHRREWGRDVPPHPGTPLVRIRILSLFGTADIWRVPIGWADRPFGEVIKALKRGDHREQLAGQ
jgi:class 3 adenylate cyclase